MAPTKDELVSGATVNGLGEMLSSDAKETENRIYAVMKKDASHDDVLNYYQKWSETYDQDLNQVHYNPPKITACELESLYPNDKDIRILDCAAGTGLVGKELHNLGYSTIDALDASEPMLSKAKEKNVYKQFYLDFLGTNRLNIEDHTYDALVGTGCFCEGHVKSDCLPEMARVVRPGGKIVLVMRENWLFEVQELKENLEPTMQRLQDNGTWKWLSRKTVDRYHEDKEGNVYRGIVYIFEKL